MRFEEFKKQDIFSVEDVCRNFFRSHRELFKIKKEKVAVKNLANIVNTTIKLSNQKGFNAMSLRDLSRETGLSMGALYSYFPSKEDLLHHIQDQGQLAVKRILLEHLGDDDNPEIKLENFIRTHLYLSEIMSSWFYFFFMETKNLNHLYRKIPIESELMTEKICIDILEEGVSRNKFTIENSLLTGSVIKALLQDWYLKRWKYRQRKISVEMYSDFVIQLIESFIK